MEKEIRLSFFRRLKMSIFDFDKYHIIAVEGLGRAMMCLVKLFLLFALIVSAGSAVKVSQLLDDGIDYLSNNVPNFYFQDNQFVLESDNDAVIENHEYTDFKIILTNSETYSEDEIRDFDGIVLVFTKNNVLLKQRNSTSITSEDYSDLAESLSISNLNEVNKEYLISMVTGENAYSVLVNIFATVFISTFLTYFLTGILDTFALSLLGFIVSRLIRMPLKYGALYSLSISAVTLSVLLNAVYMVVNMFTGFVIPYFQIMYTLISYVYLIAALLIMRSEIIKKKVQIQIQIMNKNYNPEELQKQDKKNEKEENKEENKEEKQNDTEDSKGKKESKDSNGAGTKLKNNKDNPEPQANMQSK